MPIDASIALGFKPQPIQIENPLANYANAMAIQHAGNQNMLAQLQYQKAVQDMQEERAAKNALADVQWGDPTSVKNGLSRVIAVSPKLGVNLQKAYTESLTADANLTKTKQEIIDKTLGEYRKALSDVRTPEDARAWTLAQYGDPRIADHMKRLGGGPERALAQIDAVANDPEAFTALIQRKALGMDEYIKQNKPHFLSQDTGGTVKVLAMPGLGGESTVVPGSEAVKTMTPDAAAMLPIHQGQLKVAQGNLGVAQGNLAVSQGRLAAETNPDLQGRLAGAREQGKTEAEVKTKAGLNLPAVEATAEAARKAVDELIGKRDEKGALIPGSSPHPGFSSTVGATLLPGARFVHGSPQANFISRLDQIKGGAFLQAYETLKGGGQITEIEGKKATEAINRMSIAQSEKEFVSAAKDFMGAVDRGVNKLKAQAGVKSSAATVVQGAGIEFNGYRFPNQQALDAYKKAAGL